MTVQTRRKGPGQFASKTPWTILFVAIATAVMTGPGQTIGVSVFIDHFVVDLDLTRSQVSAAYLVGTLTGATALPFVGRFVDRRGVRLAQVLVGSGFVLALVNMSFVNGIVWLSIGFVGIRMLGQGSLSLVSTVTVSVAFTERRGLALGLFAVASAGLMALVPYVLNLSIDAIGWEKTWLAAAVAVGVTVIPLGWFGLVSLPRGNADPEETGAGGRKQLPDSSAVNTPVSTGSPVGPGLPMAAFVAGRVVPRSFTRAEAVRTRSFWIITVASSTAGMLTTALNFHQIDLLGAAGLSEGAAAAMFIPQVVGSTIAGLGFGYAADRLGARFLPAIAMALLAVAHLLAATAAPGVAVVAYAISLGASGGAVRVVTATLLPKWFGTAHIGSIQGIQNLVGVGASALGPVALALTQSAYGSYPPAVLTLAAIPTVSMLFALTRDHHIRPVEE